MKNNEKLTKIIGFQEAVIKTLDYLDKNHAELMKQQPVEIVIGIAKFLSSVKPNLDEL